MQSTGQTSTQARSFTPMQASTITYVIAAAPLGDGQAHRVRAGPGRASSRYTKVNGEAQGVVYLPCDASPRLDWRSCWSPRSAPGAAPRSRRPELPSAAHRARALRRRRQGTRPHRRASGARQPGHPPRPRRRDQHGRRGRRALRQRLHRPRARFARPRRPARRALPHLPAARAPLARRAAAAGRCGSRASAASPSRAPRSSRPRPTRWSTPPCCAGICSRGAISTRCRFRSAPSRPIWPTASPSS